MSDTVIKVESLAKSYMLAHTQPRRYIALRDVLTDKAASAARKLATPFIRMLGRPDAGGERARASHEEFWALGGVSFDVARGERVGIIGRNGAGKSTLLKILSRITEPTVGRVLMKGRVASLLEVGTGFHPELTGRENIYLNGAILGMSRAEIARNFDDIVDFAGVEKFLDTPVKRYSSGMSVRLAFAVAAHLDTDVLLMDEVLAVGDAEFQKKCLGKMRDVSGKDGRTVLFVSHNMLAVEQFCGRVLRLEKGRIVSDTTDVPKAIRQYLDSGRGGEKNVSEWLGDGEMFANRWFVPLRFAICGSDGAAVAGPVDRHDDVWIEIEGTIEQENPLLYIQYAIWGDDPKPIYATSFTDWINSGHDLGVLKKTGRLRLRSKLPVSLLNNGDYYLDLYCGLYGQESITVGPEPPRVSMTVEGFFSRSPMFPEGRQGTLISPMLEWERSYPTQ
ncbi:MAG: ABC transporter ATP-binding protein [Synergistaceae bacterium]|jgi:lipopolysaccharide transport system ATP-binding protein|nr:ABC transporter ATP-binding protein [Synergistaceae bacterium]